MTFYERLRTDKLLAARCASSLLRDHFPSSLHQDILLEVGLTDLDTVAAAVRDTRFRRETIAAYGHRCAICGFDVRLGDGLDLAIEAAHLKWHQAGGPDLVQNGLALCAIHHKALDLGAITLDQRRRVLVSASVYGQDAMTRWFDSFHRRCINPPHSASLLPDRAFLLWHSREVFRSPARD